MFNTTFDFAIYAGQKLNVTASAYLSSKAIRSGGSVLKSKNGSIVAYKELVERNNPNHYIISAYKNSKLYRRVTVALAKDDTANTTLRTTKNSNFETGYTTRHSSISTFDSNNKKISNKVHSYTFNSQNSVAEKKLAVSENGKNVFQIKSKGSTQTAEDYELYKDYNLTFIDTIQSWLGKFSGKSKRDAENMAFNRYF